MSWTDRGMLSDVQSAWALLLHCTNVRATFLLRVVRPEMVQRFAERHDRGLWRCLSTILGVHPEQCDSSAKDAATLPLALGGLGLRSAVRTSVSAYWASWADSLAMTHLEQPPSRVEREHRERRITPRLADSEKALLRSQSGPGAGLALSATPSNCSCRTAPHLFRVLLLRLPLPLVSVDVAVQLGHHRAARRRRQGIDQRDGERFGLEGA